MVLAEVNTDTELITTSRGLTLECESADAVITKSLKETGRWEEPVAEAIERFLQPGWTFLDIGAHVGYFSTLAAKRGNPVIAYEARREYAEMLRRNAERNDLEIEVNHVAVGDFSGTGKLFADTRFIDNPGASYLRKSELGDVHVLPLIDLLGERRPEFIKLDVEGLEYRILKAAPEILAAAQVIVFEAGFEMCERYGTSVAQLIHLLQDSGFSVMDSAGNPIPVADIYTMPKNGYVNFVACRNVTKVQLEEPVTTAATIILCAWRNLLAETAECMLMLRDRGWAYMIKRGDALITRSRSIAVSSWYRNRPDDDVFLMIDDDVVFLPEHAEHCVKLAREKHSIVCGAYPVKDGTHFACRRFPGQQIEFGENTEPVEIVYPATGFMAVHRDVIDAMIAAKTPEGLPHFPECGDGDGRMWPFFDTFWLTGPDGKSEYLSEDYAFGEVARQLGFKVWLDTTVNLFHMGYYPYCLENMQGVVKK